MAANKARMPLAVGETGMGVAEDKVTGNRSAGECICNAYRCAKTCGAIEEDAVCGIRQITEPIGLAAVIPTANPASAATGCPPSSSSRRLAAGACWTGPTPAPELAEKYLRLLCKKADMAIRYVQTWMPVVAARQLTKHREAGKELLKQWIRVAEYQ